MRRTRLTWESRVRDSAEALRRHTMSSKWPRDTRRPSLAKRNKASSYSLLVKPIGWSDARSLAVNDDEAYAMMDGIAALQRALAEAGYAPR